MSRTKSIDNRPMFSSSFFISTAELADLDDLAGRLGLSRSAVIRIAIRKMVKHHEEIQGDA